MKKLFTTLLVFVFVNIHAQEHPIFQKGIDYFNAKKYKEAIGSFQDYLNTVNANNSGALFNIGLSHYRIQNYDSAIYYYKKCLVVAPNYLNANVQLGVAYDVTGKYNDAVYYLNKAIQIDPTKDNSYYELAVAHFYAKKYDAADTCLKKAIQLNNKNAKYFNLLARCYDEKQVADMALYNYKQALALDSNYLEALRRTGDLFVKTKNFSEAKKYFEKAYQINRLNPDVLLGYGNAYFNNGEYAASIPYYKDAVIANNKWETGYEYLGDALRLVKNYPEAITAYNKVLTINAKNVTAIYFLGVLHAAQNNMEEAKKYQKLLIPLDATKAENLAGFIK